MQPLSKARPDVKSPKVSLFKGKESIGEEPLSPFRGSLESKRGPERSIIKKVNSGLFPYNSEDTKLPLLEAISALASDLDLI